jgi:diadenosine tetraphosphate (Ap4A) HIT family hydrolase
LILPKQHVGSFFDLMDAEHDALLALVPAAKAQVDLELNPSAYNVGINDGKAAGQTVPRLYIHLIPRPLGDRTEPRGGVRLIIPEKADYWSRR